jgi:S-adenosylmethionine/arginine decarboxylase-like enzyme
MGPVGLEFLGQKFFLVHRSHSHVVFRHGYDERNRADVTANRCGGVKTEQAIWSVK